MNITFFNDRLQPLKLHAGSITPTSGQTDIMPLEMVTFPVPEGTEDVFIKVWESNVLMIQAKEKPHHPNF